MATKTKRRKRSSGGAVARRRPAAMSAAPRRRRRTRSKGGLSELFSKETAMQSGKTVLGGLAGGAAAATVNGLIPASWGKLGKLGAGVLIGFVASSVLNMPSAGAGFTGGMTALAFQNGILNDDANFADPNVLDEDPLYLDEDGNQMVMNEDGSFSQIEDAEFSYVD
jgi:hypothetical protein